MTRVSNLLFATTVALAGASLATAQDATYVELEGASGANDLTPDGRVVVGSHVNGAYYWTQEEGFTFIGGLNAVAVSDDGTIILGQMADPEGGGHDIAGIWNATDGWQSLGTLPNGLACPSLSSSYELSADGTVATGLGWQDGCDAYAFRWTQETGMLAMEHLANGGNRASAISGDGTLIGGFAQGSFSRTPAIWYADGTGELLDPPNGDVLGEVYGITDDGQTLLGAWNDDAFKWTAGEGLETWGSLTGGVFRGIAMDVDDAGTVVGFDIFQLSRRAWVRPAGESSPVSLPVYLTDAGAEGVPSVLEVAQAISTDGTVIIGHGIGTGAFVATLGGADCAADTNGDDVVNVDDMLAVIGAWGPNPGDPADLDGDGVVGVDDLLIVLGDWGPCA